MAGLKSVWSELINQYKHLEGPGSNETRAKTEISQEEETVSMRNTQFMPRPKKTDLVSAMNCIRIWIVRSMNQGKWQEMERVNINILGISELKMGGNGQI